MYILICVHCLAAKILTAYFDRICQRSRQWFLEWVDASARGADTSAKGICQRSRHGEGGGYTKCISFTHTHHTHYVSHMERLVWYVPNVVLYMSCRLVCIWGPMGSSHTTRTLRYVRLLRLWWNLHLIVGPHRDDEQADAHARNLVKFWQGMNRYMVKHVNQEFAKQSLHEYSVYVSQVLIHPASVSSFAIHLHFVNNLQMLGEPSCKRFAIC